MPALLSVTVQIQDLDKLKHYMAKVPDTMQPFGARLISRGKVIEMLHGSLPHQMEATFEFESEQLIEKWYQSDAYQALISERDAAAKMNIAILSPF